MSCLYLSDASVVMGNGSRQEMGKSQLGDVEGSDVGNCQVGSSSFMLTQVETWGLVLPCGSVVCMAV